MSQNEETAECGAGSIALLPCELEGAEGGLSLRHCLHLNVISYI